MKIYTHIIFVLLCLQQATAQIFINEVQTSNDVTIVDNFLEADDWIELYNPTGTSIDLAGYFISDDGDDLLQHQIKTGDPALTTIPANGYLLLWADKDEEQGVHHLNFKLKSDGETIYLTNSDGVSLIDSLQVPTLEDDESYIRKPDGTNNVYVNPTPAPEASNNNVTLNLTDPVINLPGGKYSSTQTISINADAGADIYYTTDGSTPTTSSTIYNGAFNLNTSASVKAFAVKPGFRDSKMVYESYILGATSDLSIVNISIDPDYLFDDQVGFYTEGTNGLIGPCMDEPKNWWQDWEYEATVTLYEENGDIGFNEACGIQISGGCSRNKDKKSFNVKFKSEYGEKNLNYKLFEDTDVDFFDGFKLRNGGSPGTMRIQDVVAQKTMENQFDIDMQHSRPVALYINGEYWGLYHIRDRINTGYLQSYHTKVDHDNVDYIKFPGSNGSWRWWATQEVKSGDDVAYNEMHNYAVNNDLSIDVNYQTLTEQLDVNELTNYLISHIYLNNGDWPENNIKIWKERTENSKWRWAFFDVDFINWYNGGYTNVGLFDQFMNETDAAERRNPKSTELYRNLFDNASFKNEFVQKMNTYIHTVWDYNRTNPLFLEAKNKVASEIDADFNRWGGWDFNKWNTEVNKLDEYFMNRPAYARTMVKNVLGLGETMDLTLNFDANTPGSILLHQNFFEVPSNYQATYFENMEMHLHAIPKPGYRFVQWNEISDTQFKYSQNIYKSFGNNKTLTPVFEPALDLVINEIHYNPEGKEEDNEFIEIYNPGDKARSLWGYQFTNGITFQFPEDAVIQANEYVVVVHNDSAYVNKDYQVFEWERGSLDNDGEAIVFSNAANEVIDSVYYNDNDLWNQSADGLGFSLALLDDVTDNNFPTSWDEQTSSVPVTPGRKNAFCTVGASCDDGDSCTTEDVYDTNCYCIGTNNGNEGTISTASLTPVADAFVRGSNYADTNYGSSTELLAKLAGNNKYHRRSYVKFDLSAYNASDLVSAILELNLVNNSTNNTNQNLFHVQDDSWTENGITWNNQPGSASLINSFPAPLAGQSVSIDITEAVTSALNENNILSLKIEGTNNKYIGYASREQGAPGPKLTLTIGGGCDDEPCPDGDNDGICDADDNTNGNCTLNAACDDGDSCTTGDTYDANCNCVGTAIADSDNDGICDAIDNTNGNCTLNASCDDGDSCTTGDAYDANCNCAGTPTADSDNDGICDANDNTNGNCTLNATCDDGDPCTSGETYDANCNCSGGTPVGNNSNGTLTPTDDTFIRGGSYASSNYGNSTTIHIKKGGNDKWTRYGYLKFDLSAVNANQLQNAKLRLKISSNNGTNVAQELLVAPNDNWTEGNLTWSNNQFGGSSISNFTAPAAGQWVEIDVTSAVQTEASGDDVISFAITSTNNKYIKYHTKESSGNEPELVLTYQSCNNNRLGKIDESKINIYPNPAQDFINIDLLNTTKNIEHDKAVNLKIFSTDGRLLMQQVMPNTASLRMDVQALPSNQYYLISIEIEGTKLRSNKFLKL